MSASGENRSISLIMRSCSRSRTAAWIGRRALEGDLAAILTAPTRCDLARDLQGKFRRACDQLLTFIAFPGAVDVTNNGCERSLRPSVVQRKVTNGYRSTWAAEGEADIRTVVDTARLGPGPPAFSTILKTVGA